MEPDILSDTMEDDGADNNNTLSTTVLKTGKDRLNEKVAQAHPT